MLYEKQVTTILLAAFEPVLAKQGLDIELITDWQGQHVHGDLWLHDRTGNKAKKKVSVDIKSERQARANLFFETHSNFEPGPRFKPGWGYTIKADWLWYHFQSVNALALIDLVLLRKWLFAIDPDTRTHRLDGFEYKEQKCNAQKNITGAKLIPFIDIPQEVFPCGYLLESGLAVKCSRQTFLERIPNAKSKPNLHKKHNRLEQHALV